MPTHDKAESPYSPLLPDAGELLRRIGAPPRLVAHLILVHDVARKLLSELRAAFPQLQADDSAILFGAATHDIGKVKHPKELSHPGTLHEVDGAALLQGFGVTPKLARFARTHGDWQHAGSIEDLIVSLADN